MKQKFALVASVMAALLIVGAVLVLTSRPTQAAAAAVTSVIKISQVFGGGGNSGAPYQNDFVELFNAGAVAVDISGWSLQYGSAAGTLGGSTGTNLFVLPANTTLQSGRYLLVKLSGGSVGVTFTADLTSTAINMSGASGKIALANVSAWLNCGGVGALCPQPDSRIVDFVAYGNVTTTIEGTSVNFPTGLANTQGALRKMGGCQDTDNNNADFTVVVSPTLAPRNTSSPANMCIFESDLAVLKTGPGLATPGDTLNYVINLSNRGNFTATSTLVTDTLPTGVNFVTYTTSLSNIFSQSGNDLIWDIGDVLSQTTGLTISVQVTVPTSVSLGTVLTNSVTASTTATETLTSNNTASVTTTLRQADLIVSKTGPRAVKPGAPVTYTIFITNTSYPGTTDLVVTDTLPGYMTYFTDTTGISPVISLPGTYVWTLPGVGAGSVYSFSLGTNLDAGAPVGTLTNTVDVATSNVEESTTNNYAEWPISVGGPDLIIVKQGPLAAAPGDVVSFTLTVTNTGSPATNIWLTDTLPAQMSYVSDSFGGFTSQSGQAYGWFTNTLAAGDHIVLTVSATVSFTAYAGNHLVNTAYVSEAEVDQTPEDNTSSITTTITGANPYVSTTVSSAAFVGGEPVTYTLAYGNSGTDPASDLVLTDTLPTGFSYASDTSGFVPNVNGNVITWSLPAVNTVAPISFTLVATVTTGTPLTQGTLVTNTVAIGPSVPGNNPIDDTASVTGTVYQIVPIATARAGTTNQVFAITGTVTVEPGVFTYNGQNRYMYVQDGTAGVLVYRDGGLNSVARGHIVRIVGALNEYKAETEFSPANAADVVDRGPGTAVSPLVTNTGSINEAVEGELVQISGLVTGKPAAFRLQVNDGSGMVEVNRYYNLGQITDTNYIDFSPYGVGDYVRVTGITRGYTETFGFTREVLPRGPIDIVEYPRVLSTGPISGATGVPLAATITATFNMTMTNVDGTRFILTGPSGAVAGTATFDAATKTAVFTPTAALAANTLYTATLKATLQADNGLTLMPAQDYVWSFRMRQTAPDLSTSTKTNSTIGTVKAGELITYTVTLINTGDANATAIITDVLNSSYTVGRLLDFTQPTTGTLTWTGVVTAGQSVSVQFVAQVKGVAQLPIGPALLLNSAAVNDGVHAPITINDPQPPTLTIYGLYLPLVRR